MRFSKSIVIALVAVSALVAVTPAIAATKASLAGTSAVVAVSDSRSTFALGTGAEVKIFKDGKPTPTSAQLPAGCGLAAATQGTAVSDCYVDGAPQFSLVSLTNGTTRALPGANKVANTISGPSETNIDGMGSQWLTGLYCTAHCTVFALQWHTGAVRLFESDYRFLPATVLDSTSLKAPATAPYAVVDEATGKWSYHRGRISKSLGAQSTNTSWVSSMRVYGWRAAWITNQGKGGPPNAVTVRNAKTGKQRTIPFSRFATKAYHPPSGDAATVTTLVITARKLVLSFVPSGSKQYAVTSIAWPSGI